MNKIVPDNASTPKTALYPVSNLVSRNQSIAYDSKDTKLQALLSNTSQEGRNGSLLNAYPNHPNHLRVIRNSLAFGKEQHLITNAFRLKNPQTHHVQ